MGTPTDTFIDPAIAGDSGTGTIGDPYGDSQFALNDMTRDSTNGDQLNVKNGTDEILAAILSYATYGTPSLTAPVIWRGYTSAKDDGGVGGLDGNNGNFSVSTQNFVSYIDMHLFNTGSAEIVDMRSAVLIRCELDTSTSNGLGGSNGGRLVLFCNLHNIAGIGLSGGGTDRFIGNYLKNGTNDFSTAINLKGGDIAERNILSLDGSTHGISLAADNTIACFNSILAASGTGTGIRFPGANFFSRLILNNLVEGFSGTGGKGIDESSDTELAVVAGNALFNNTTNYANTGDRFFAEDNEELGATPFDKSGSDTFANRFVFYSPVDTGNVRGGAIVS